MFCNLGINSLIGIICFSLFNKEKIKSIGSYLIFMNFILSLLDKLNI